MSLRRLALATAMTVVLSHAASAVTMRIGIGDDPDQLDPALSAAFAARVVLTTFCAKLFDVTPNLQVVPNLASGFEWSPDGKIMTIKLRPGLKFDDGEALDAEAVKYNFERNLTIKGSLRKSELSAVTSVDVVDPLTARVNLSEPQAPLPSILAERAGMMISPKAGKALGENFGSNPVCAGPYKFVSREPQGRIIFEKSPTYFDAANVAIDRVEFLAVNDSTVRLANLQSGQFDLIERVSPTDIEQIKKDGRLRLLSAPDLGYGLLQVNVGNGPRGKLLGSDPRLREAIDLAIDREQLVKVAFDNAFIAGNQFVGPGSYYTMKDVPLPKRDLAKAKQLLKEAGQPNLTFKLITRPDRDFQVPAQVIQAMLHEAGINMIIDTMENVTAINNTSKGDYDVRLTFWSGRVDPDGNTRDWVACNGPLNYSKYCNADMDKMLIEARQINEPASRKVLYHKVQKMLMQERPVIPLWYRQIFYATSARVQGFVGQSDGLVRLVGVKIQ